MLDWNKPLRTIDGHRPCLLLTRDFIPLCGSGPKNLLMHEGPGGASILRHCDDNGVVGFGERLVENVPETKVEYRNVYREIGGLCLGQTAFQTRHDANDGKPFFCQVRVGVVRIELVEGQYAD